MLELDLAIAVGQQAVVANALEARRQHMQQEATHELLRVEAHGLAPRLVTVVLPREGDPAVGEVDQAVVGDRHAMGVAAEIVEHLLGPPKGGLA